jgi:hypothetical protein
MPPISPDLHPGFLRIRRSISDALISNRFDPETSHVHRFVVEFGSQFPVSRGIFANSFADFVLGSLEDARWSYLEDDPENPHCFWDFPRSVTSTSGTQELIFYPKTTRGINGGLKVEWIRDGNHMKFYTKLCQCPMGRPVSKSSIERALDVARSFGRQTDYTDPDSSHLNQMALDFREIAIYLILESVGAGPRVLFFMDASCAGSLHILTEEVQGAIFMTTEEEERNYKRRYLKNPRGILDATMIALILGLRDLHRHNYCLTPESGTRWSSVDPEFPLKIIDFIAPEDYRDPHFPEPRFQPRIFYASPLESLPVPPDSICESAFNTAVFRLEHLRPGKFRLAVYPKIAEGSDLASLADFAEPETDSSAEPMSYSEFLLDVENQLRDSLLNTTRTPFPGRPLAELFGLTDIANVWTGQQFDDAIASASENESIVAFDWFFGTVFKIMEGGPPPPIAAGTANKSINYALTMLRWFEIWIGRRIRSMREFFCGRGKPDSSKVHG